MQSRKFRAYAIANELDLNKIAVEFGIPKKYTWEEPLVLGHSNLRNIFKKDYQEDQQIFVFSFGSVVFVNIPSENELTFFKYLSGFKPDLDIKNYQMYTDNYELRVEPEATIELNDQFVVVPEFQIYYPELVSIVIAKSAALEKTEEQLSIILDKLEHIIDRLDKGKMSISNKELARSTARIIRHQYNSIAYIMILDKPGIAWQQTTAEEFYNQMSEFFELNDRYEILKSKTDILNHIIGGFASIRNSIRGLFVEWIVVVLIVIEVILMVADLLKVT